MRVYIQYDNGKEMIIPVPSWCMRAVLNKHVLGRIKMGNNKKAQEMLQCIDWQDIKRLLQELKGYKGLKLIEVESKEERIIIEI